MYTQLTLVHCRHTSVFANAPVDSLDNGMRAGARGPTTIDDPVARERISHFDHERFVLLLSHLHSFLTR